VAKRIAAVALLGLTETPVPPARTSEGEAMMPGDPKECRLHALRCAELATTAKTPQLRATFLDLSKGWVRLAESLEKPGASLAAAGWEPARRASVNKVLDRR
jgi:hypothetical protein